MCIKYYIILSAIFFLTNITIAQVNYTVSGIVTDKIDNSPLIGVSVLIIEAKTGAITDINGQFKINNIAKGNYQVRFSYIGHATESRKIIVPSDESRNLNVQLSETAIDMKDVVITGNIFHNESENIVKPLISLSSLDLEKVRSNSIGDMLNYQAGVSVVTNGTAVSRPVIRGFGSSRVIILEDGLRMGDLSGSSSDHSVSEDGSNPDKIEIVRGASSLLYTSSSPGGVINIITDLIPGNIPSKMTGSLSLGGNSVSEQKFGNAELFYGSNRVSYEAGAFYRKGNSYRIPSGERVSNSDLEGKGIRGGLSFHPQWGTFGFGANVINNIYGIPFNTKEVSDEGPVYLNMKKSDFKGLLELDSVSSDINQIDLKLGFQDYKHSEISRITQQAGSIFYLTTMTGDLLFKHNLFTSSPILNSAFGLWGLKQKYKVRGEEALTPDADISGLALYIFEELNLSFVNIQGSLRYEHNTVNMSQAVLSDSSFDAMDKKFNTLSSSISMSFPVSDVSSLFLELSDMLRTPGVEELGSYAIHPALASFDVGNRSLNKENNYGAEAGVRLNGKRYFIEMNGYYNYINNYIFRNPSSIFYQNGTFNTSSGMPVYFYRQTTAEMYGAEFKSIIDIADGLSLTLTSDYVRGRYKELDQNLPQIPPMRLSIEPKYVKDSYWMGLIWKGASAQDKLAENETPTKGFGVLDLYGGVKFFTGNIIHQIDFKAENVMNQEYREHLSALKNFAPMPGRNFLLSYKLLF